MIEVCLCLYQRMFRIAEIVENLKKQTRQDFRLNIWNNGSQKITIKNFPEEHLLVVNNERNIGSQARFRLLPLTTGNPILFIDDDLKLHSDFIDYYYSQHLRYGKNSILGWSTRIFHTEDYWDSIIPDPAEDTGVLVDYVGTGGMILDREIFDNEEILQNIPNEWNRVEDLFLCYIARQKRNMDLRAIESRCDYITDELDQYHQLLEYKRKAFHLLRKNDWKLLKDVEQALWANVS